MSVAKIAISIDDNLLKKLDYFISKKKFRNRSQAIQVAVDNTLEKLEHRRLAHECAKLDASYEQKLADEGLDGDIKEWPIF